MIQMHFTNFDNGKTSWTICDRQFVQVFVQQMGDKGFVWVSTDIL